ncbi:MAG: phosphoglycolate phosphatase [Proteobacteria bacterium]|nr:phosphoglycolate phosphatase [Pseudomonadota bacterium]
MSDRLKRTYAGYLFDLDGTLIDTAPDLHQALLSTLDQFGMAPVDESLTRHWIGHGARAMIEQALKHQSLSADQDMEEMWKWFITAYESHIAVHSKPYPGVVDTLTRLQGRGAQLAVVTNKIEVLSAKILSELKMAAFFEVLIGGDTTAHAKPAATPALEACARLKLSITDVLFVGDSVTDVDCARAAGCDVVCVRDGYNQGVAAHSLGADAVIDSFLDLV